MCTPDGPSTRARAWRFDHLGGPENLRLDGEDLPFPAAGQALLRLRTIGLNRSDLLYMAGRYLTPPPSPSCLGQEAVGEVVALGPPGGGAPAIGFHPGIGDRVGLLVGRVDYAGMGTFRDYGLYPQDALLPVPESYDDARAAGLWIAALTAAGGLRAGGLSPTNAPGKKVLVTAASSGVGTVALQIARAWGAETLAATTSEAKTAAIADLADRVLLTPDPDALATRAEEATGGHGIDFAFDPVGFAYIPALFRAAAVGGSVVFYGIMAGNDAPFDLRSLLRKDLNVHGFTIYRLIRNPEFLDTVVGDVMRLADAGTLAPLVAEEYPFEQAPRALEALASNRHLGKIVLKL